MCYGSIIFCGVIDMEGKLSLVPFEEMYEQNDVYIVIKANGVTLGYEETFFIHEVTGVKFKETRDMEDYCKNLIGKKERYEATKDLLERSEILKLFPDYKTYAGVDESNFDKYRHDHTLNYNYADGDRNLSDLVEQAMNLERDIQVMVVAK